MKIKNLILKLQQLEQDLEIYYSDENEEQHQLIVIENQLQDIQGETYKSYTIEKM